jgi:16S rRNA (guanine527-N7)-methyltransferase
VKHPEAALRAYRDLLVAEPVSVTSVRDPRAAWDLHVADALTALDLVLRLAPETVVDVGSGGGSPGIPIAIATGIDVTLLEASAAKCDFLRRTTAVLGLRCPIVHNRSEEFARNAGREAFDLALARALAPPGAAAELCLPLVRVGGRVLLWTADTDIDTLERIAAEGGGAVVEAVAVRPNRHLVLLAKRASTPDRFPRRPGMATKRPLGQVRSRT